MCRRFRRSWFKNALHSRPRRSALKLRLAEVALTAAVFANRNLPKERPPEGGLQGMKSVPPYAKADTLLLRER
jgi:hypothetical protein